MKQPLPVNAALFTTSWDDGHPLDFRIAGMLSKYGLGGTFYAPRTCHRQTMGPAQLRELAGRFEIGAHTLNHVKLTGVSDAAAEAEIRGSKRWVEEATGRRCEMFCYPGGLFRPAHQAMVRKAGFLGDRTVEFLSTKQPRRAGRFATLATSVQAYPHSGVDYLRNLLKRRRIGAVCGYPLHFSGKTWMELTDRLLVRAVRDGGVFHLWGHSWEVQEQGLWGELDAVFKKMSGYRSAVRNVCNSEVCIWTNPEQMY
jgi:peptidoglycan/xylan/chitin deacetylase (PgdA/CDA1 family)